MSGSDVIEGLAKAGRQRSDIEVTCPVFVVTGEDEEAWMRQREAVTRHVTFSAGPRVCPGATLSRLEQQIAWGVLLAGCAATIDTLRSREMTNATSMVFEMR